jgi:hypothetical protein
MGTLGNQPERNSYIVHLSELDAFLDEATKLANKYSITVESVIAAKKVLELERRNSILSLAGDYHDEQMGGFGDILSRIADTLESRE